MTSAAIFHLRELIFLIIACLSIFHTFESRNFVWTLVLTSPSLFSTLINNLFSCKKQINAFFITPPFFSELCICTFSWIYLKIGIVFVYKLSLIIQLKPVFLFRNALFQFKQAQHKLKENFYLSDFFSKWK